jgi:hypothetical protein
VAHGARLRVDRKTSAVVWILHAAYAWIIVHRPPLAAMGWVPAAAVTR